MNNTKEFFEITRKYKSLLNSLNNSNEGINKNMLTILKDIDEINEKVIKKHELLIFEKNISISNNILINQKNKVIRKKIKEDEELKKTINDLNKINIKSSQIDYELLNKSNNNLKSFNLKSSKINKIDKQKKTISNKNILKEIKEIEGEEEFYFEFDEIPNEE